MNDARLVLLVCQSVLLGANLVLTLVNFASGRRYLGYAAFVLAIFLGVLMVFTVSQ